MTKKGNIQYKAFLSKIEQILSLVAYFWILRLRESPSILEEAYPYRQTQYTKLKRKKCPSLPACSVQLCLPHQCSCVPLISDSSTHVLFYFALWSNQVFVKQKRGVGNL